MLSRKGTATTTLHGAYIYIWSARTPGLIAVRFLEPY